MNTAQALQELLTVQRRFLGPGHPETRRTKQILSAWRKKWRTAKAAPGSPRGGTSGLVLARKPGERIMLGDDIVIQIDSIIGSTVRLRVRAPASLPIFREEIYQEKRPVPGQAEENH